MGRRVWYPGVPRDQERHRLRRVTRIPSVLVRSSGHRGGARMERTKHKQRASARLAVLLAMVGACSSDERGDDPALGMGGISGAAAAMGGAAAGMGAAGMTQVGAGSGGFSGSTA